MNKEILIEKWNQVKGKFKEHWGKFSANEEIVQPKGKKEQLSRKASKK